MWDPYSEFKSATLPNGLTIHAAHWPERPWEAIGFVIHSGAETDPVGLEGVAHFVEHLVSKNADVPFKDSSLFFENCGGDVGLGSTGYDFTRYSFFIPADREIISRALSIFGQMLLQNKLTKFIERERRVIIGEYHRRYPIKYNFDLDMQERKALYAGYWLERSASPFGNLESIARITQSDLQKQYDAFYTPANVSVVCVGGVGLDELIGLFSRSPFATNKCGSRTPLPGRETDVKPPLENRYVFEYSKHISASAPFEVGSYRSVAVIPGDVDVSIRAVKRMLNEILDDEVRQSRAWTYDIGSAFYNFRRFHEFAINCGTLDLKALDDIEDVVDACVASLTEREDLFLQAKKYLIARNRMIDPNGRGIRDVAMDDLIDFDRIVPLTEYGERLEALTMSDIRNLLPWIRPERRWTLITRP